MIINPYTINIPQAVLEREFYGGCALGARSCSHPQLQPYPSTQTLFFDMPLIDGGQGIGDGWIGVRVRTIDASSFSPIQSRSILAHLERTHALLFFNALSVHPRIRHPGIVSPSTHQASTLRQSIHASSITIYKFIQCYICSCRRSPSQGRLHTSLTHHQ